VGKRTARSVERTEGLSVKSKKKAPVTLLGNLKEKEPVWSENIENQRARGKQSARGGSDDSVFDGRGICGG